MEAVRTFAGDSDLLKSVSGHRQAGRPTDLFTNTYSDTHI